ncbi:MAG: hypothetical protein IT324_22030 [Anaerolineae bacterium]|nr:hypothetical protein [Anaerolineae bacterium]
MSDQTVESDGYLWQHLDYYVRREGDDLVLVQTLLRRQVDHPPDQAEICTVYITLDQLEPDWAEAVLSQGADLEHGKSCDFVPPDEVFDYYDEVYEDED